jgi:hypothetical protein
MERTAGPLLQQHPPGHRLHVGVRERHPHREAVEQLGELLGSVERALPGAHDHHPAAQLLRDRLGHVGEDRGAVVGVADVLLDLVQDQQGAGLFVTLRAEAQDPAERVEELLAGDVRPLRRELALDRTLRVGVRRSERGIALAQRRRDVAAHVEVIELRRPGLSRGFLHRFPHALEPALLVQPEGEHGLRVLLREPERAQQHAEHREPYVLGAAGRQRTRRGKEPAPAPAGGVQLAQRVTDVLGQVRHQAAGGGPVRELRVHPQVSEHLEEVRLAAPVEAAHPGALLAGAAQPREVGEEDAKDALRVLPFAHERGQLATQLLHHPLVTLIGPVGDAGLSVVDERVARRVAEQDILDLGHVGPPPCSVIGTAM